MLKFSISIFLKICPYFLESHKMNSDECLNEILDYFKTRKTKETLNGETKELLTSLGFRAFRNGNLTYFDFMFPEIIPIRGEKGVLNLKVPIVPYKYRPIVSTEGYILGEKAQNYISSLLNGKLWKLGNTYNLKYDNEKLTIVKHQFSPKMSSTTRTYKNPIFKFPLSQWPFADPPVPLAVRNKFPWYYAIPWTNPINIDDPTFLVWAPDWEEELQMEHPKSEKIIRLMVELRKKHADRLPQLSDYMLRTVVLHQLPVVNWQRDWVSLLSEMWTRLVNNLRAERIDSFLMDELNLLDCMEPTELEQCEAFARELLSKILEARYSGSRDDLEALFGIALN